MFILFRVERVCVNKQERTSNITLNHKLEFIPKLLIFLQDEVLTGAPQTESTQEKLIVSVHTITTEYTYRHTKFYLFANQHKRCRNFNNIEANRY